MALVLTAAFVGLVVCAVALKMGWIRGVKACLIWLLQLEGILRVDCRGAVVEASGGYDRLRRSSYIGAIVAVLIVVFLLLAVAIAS